jgi:hypothetical protein
MFLGLYGALQIVTKGPRFLGLLRVIKIIKICCLGHAASIEEIIFFGSNRQERVHWLGKINMHWSKN